ncbi:ABC transporter substrate-binding protein [soil metagenome]
MRKTTATLKRPLSVTAVIALAATLSACGSSSDGTAASSDHVTIGVLQIAPAAIIDDTIKAFEKKLTSELGPDTEVTFKLKNANGDQSLITSIARDFASSDMDAFAVIGTPAVIALAQQVRDKPIFALAIGDPVGSKVAKTLDEPGGNVTGSIDYVEPGKLLDDIEQADPKPASIGTVYDPSNQNMAIWSQALKKAADADGIKVVSATISGPSDVSAAARSLKGRTDAILIGPDATVLSAIDAVGAVSAAAKLPLYVVGGDVSVKGVLASIGPNYPALGELAAIAAAKALDVGSAAKVPFGQPSKVEVSFNKDTMATLGITFPQALLDSATAP